MTTLLCLEGWSKRRARREQPVAVSRVAARLRVSGNPTPTLMTSLRSIVPLALLASACTTFSTVRSAEVSPGPSATIQVSGSTPTGDEAGWFYSYDCATSCSLSVPGGDLGMTFGTRDENGRGSSAGFGMSGFFPYLELYTELTDSKRRPFGVGGRVGLPLIGWAEHRLYGRFDFVSADGSERLLWNPGVFVTHGTSPNGENGGAVLGFVNGFGIQASSGRVVVTPSVSLVHARASHESWGEKHGPEWSTFVTAGLGLTIRRKPDR